MHVLQLCAQFLLRGVVVSYKSLMNCAPRGAQYYNKTQHTAIAIVNCSDTAYIQMFGAHHFNFTSYSTSIPGWICKIQTLNCFKIMATCCMQVQLYTFFHVNLLKSNSSAEEKSILYNFALSRKMLIKFPTCVTMPVKCNFPLLTLQWLLLCQSTNYQQQSLPKCNISGGHKWNICWKLTKKRNGLPTEQQLRLLDDVIYRGHAMTQAAVWKWESPNNLVVKRSIIWLDKCVWELLCFGAS